MKKLKKHMKYINMAVLVLVAMLYAFGIIGVGDAGASVIGLLPVLFGTVAAAANSPDLTSGTDGSGEIPYLYASKTVEKFYDVSVAPFTANTDYEGQIKKQGDTVIINTIPNVAIQDYTVNGVINWELLKKGRVELKVNRASYYAFRMDDVTLAQLADKKTMDEYSADGAEQMRITIDTKYLADVYLNASTVNKGAAAGKSGSYNLGATGSALAMNKGNITEVIARAAAVGNEQNWPLSGRWMVLPTWAKYLLDTSELKDVGITGASLSFMVNGGYFKSLYDFDLFVSNLYTAVSDTGANCYNITFGHKSGVTFAAQLTEMQYHEKFETTFGKGMKGLQVYDWKVVKPEALGVVYGRLA